MKKNKTYFYAFIFAFFGWQANAQTYLDEDFGGNTFPPEGWTIDGSANNSWLQHYSENNQNYYAVFSNSDSNLDESLITPTLDFSESAGNIQLTFWFSTNYKYAVGENDYDLTVSIKDTVTNQVDTLWVEDSYGKFINNKLYEVTLNLTAYQGEKDLQLIFNYSGSNCFEIRIDNVAVKETTTWTGKDESDSHDWHTATNWSPENIPGLDANVIIPSGLTNYPTASLEVSVNSVIMESGSSLIATSTFSGEITYKRNLGTANWYLVSSPIAGENMNRMRLYNKFEENNQSKISFASYINSHSNAADRWSYFSNSSSEDLVSGKGYSTKLLESADIFFTGTLHTEDVSIALTQGGANGNDYNLLGNPYPSYINSATFLTEGSETSDLKSATLWLWDQGTSSYVAKVAADSFKIAPGQGFFVEANSTNNVTFTEDMQSHESTDTFQRNSTSRPEVHFFMSDGYNSRFFDVYYIEGTTTGYDNGYDGELFGGVSHSYAVYTHLVSDSQGKKFQIQSLPNSNYSNMVIPIGVIADAGKEITFTAATMNLPSDIKVFLEDSETNTFTRLDEANSNYKLSLTDDLNGIGRFYLHTTESALRVPEVVLDNVSIYKTDASTLRIIGLQQGNAKLSLYNMLGKQMMSTSFSSTGVNDISLPKLAKGMYIVQLQTDAGRVNKKIILE